MYNKKCVITIDTAAVLIAGYVFLWRPVGEVCSRRTVHNRYSTRHRDAGYIGQDKIGNCNWMNWTISPELALHLIYSELTGK